MRVSSLDSLVFLLAGLLLSMTGCEANPAPVFDEPTAELFARFSAATYCCGTLGHGVEKWDCQVCNTLPKLETIVVSSQPTDTNGYIGYDSYADNIIVAFAGTNLLSIQNWIDDLNFFQTDYEPCIDTGCKVHEGFLKAYTNVKDDVKAAVRQFLSKHPSAQVFVTGHSLGAAIANFATLDLINSGIPVNVTYNYGQPRTGNVAFYDYVKKIAGPYWRVTHGRDPVPHLPLAIMNFHHVANEVFIRNNSLMEYKVCNGSGEDPDCADQYYAAVNLLDHLSYMNFDFIKNFLSCEL